MGLEKDNGAGKETCRWKKRAWCWEKKAWRWEKGAWRSAMLKGAGGNTTPELEKRIQAFEMRCNWRLLKIWYKDHVVNKEVQRKIQASTEAYDEFLTVVSKRKLRWFGHVSRSSSLAKTILQGTVNGKRRRGRQKKRWEDNIKVWTR